MKFDPTKKCFVIESIADLKDCQIQCVRQVNDKTKELWVVKPHGEGYQGMFVFCSNDIFEKVAYEPKIDFS